MLAVVATSVADVDVVTVASSTAPIAVLMVSHFFRTPPQATVPFSGLLNRLTLVYELASGMFKPSLGALLVEPFPSKVTVNCGELWTLQTCKGPEETTSLPYLLSMLLWLLSMKFPTTAFNWKAPFGPVQSMSGGEDGGDAGSLPIRTPFIGAQPPLWLAGCELRRIVCRCMLVPLLNVVTVL